MNAQEYAIRLEKPITRWLLVIPFIGWIVLYASAPKIPTSIRPEIDLYSLYNFDVAFLHYLPSTELAKLQCNFLDVLGAIAYTLHSGWPFVFLVYMVLSRRRDLLLPYFNCFGSLCFLGLITQLLLPTAPPWYYYKYGFNSTLATYSLMGDPAGLHRVDILFDTDFYKNMFDASPVVFGSFPSLHVGWPSVLAFIAYFHTDLPKALRIATWGYVAYVGLAVMYLQHHYFVDVAGGIFYAWVVYKLVGPKIRPPLPPPKRILCLNV
jgi:membrane-associated phospholipid phosphatase